MLMVQGRSMEPTYQDGGVVRSDGRPSSWCRGDVAVVRASGRSHRRELKRLVGLPGESVAWNGRGMVWINGTPLEEPHARFGPSVPGDDDMQEVILRDDEYFVVGDDRLHSRDSRQDGVVRRGHLLERVES